MLHNMLRAAAERDRIPTDGLVAWYTMDNISGSTLVDEMESYNGTISGAVSAPGLIGNALDFDGVNDQVRISSIPVNEISISTWIYTDEVFGAQYPIFTNWNPSALSWLIDIYSGNIRWVVRDGTGTPTISTSITAGSWHHIIASVSSSGNMRLRLNNGSAITQSISLSGLLNQSGNVYMGRKGDSTTNWYNGKKDQTRVYNRQINSDEETQLYNEGA